MEYRLKGLISKGTYEHINNGTTVEVIGVASYVFNIHVKNVIFTENGKHPKRLRYQDEECFRLTYRKKEYPPVVMNGRVYSKKVVIAAIKEQQKKKDKREIEEDLSDHMCAACKYFDPKKNGNDCKRYKDDLLECFRSKKGNL